MRKNRKHSNQIARLNAQRSVRKADYIRRRRSQVSYDSQLEASILKLMTPIGCRKTLV